MNNFKAKFIRFMYGRYGVDQLYYALFIAWGVIAVINCFADSLLLSILGTALVVWMFWRSMSRNLVKRRAENEKFLTFWKPVKSWLILQRDRIRDRKTARYRTCTHCKAIVKLPVKKGKHTVVCPRCKGRFDVKI
ncbi:MAG: hypothetical protein IJX93_04150 [Clostridia bacterium]|nr:hypothetical protein [Clostridia bacterium]MBQ8332944.1 hypothetical protein [Clostridia bacterium]MBQ8369649.1 hypothetical protein [Clostridia bacterium]MBQ8511638.1 hypothetical protein [Clostridia bacterium]